MPMATQQHSPARRPSVPYSVGDSDEEFSSPPTYSPQDEYNPPQFSREYSPSISASGISPTETVFSQYTFSSELSAPLAWTEPYESAGILGRQLDERARTPVTGRIPLALPDGYSRRPSAADSDITVSTNAETIVSNSSSTTNMSQVALMADIYGHLGAYPTDKPPRGSERKLDAPPRMSRAKSQVSSLRTVTVEHVPPVPAAQIPEVVDIPVIAPEGSHLDTHERGRDHTSRRDRSQARQPPAKRPHYDAAAHERLPKQDSAPPGDDRRWETPPRSRTSSRGRHHPDRRRQTPYIGELAPPPLPGRGLPDEKYGSRTAAPSTLTRQASENWSAKSARSRYDSRTSSVDDLDVETPRSTTFSFRTEASVYSTHTVVQSGSRSSARPALPTASHSTPAVPQARRHVPAPVFIPSPPSSAQPNLSRTPSTKSALSRAPSYKTVESDEQLRSAYARHHPSAHSSPQSMKNALRDSVSSWVYVESDHEVTPDRNARMEEILRRKQEQDLPMTPEERKAFPVRPFVYALTL